MFLFTANKNVANARSVKLISDTKGAKAKIKGYIANENLYQVRKGFYPVENKVQGFNYEHRHINAFDIIGFTAMVKSGGKLYDAVRLDGRWEALQGMNSKNKTIYGIASDDTCPAMCDNRTDICSKARCYRYTIGITDDENFMMNTAYGELYKYHVKESDWIVFALDNSPGFGELWRNDPYKMIAELGYEYNFELSNHIDVMYGDYDGVFEFWMPVKQRR